MRMRSSTCAARLVSDCTREASHKYFTNTYPNYMQCAGGLQDGATRCAQLLNMLHDLPTEGQDPDDPIAFINTDIAAAFQEMCCQTTFDTLSGRATKYYDGGRVKPGDAIPTTLLWDPSMVISEPCAVPPVSIATLITAVARTVSKAPLEVPVKST